MKGTIIDRICREDYRVEEFIAKRHEADVIYHLAQGTHHLQMACKIAKQMRDNEEYRTLGYNNWREYASDVFKRHWSRFYRYMQAADAADNLWPLGHKLNERTLRPLTKWNDKPTVQKFLLDVAERTAPNGRITSTVTEAVVEVFSEALVTGTLPDADAEQREILLRLEADMVDRIAERMKANRQYIQDKTGKRLVRISEHELSLQNLRGDEQEQWLDLHELGGISLDDEQYERVVHGERLVLRLYVEETIEQSTKTP